MQRELEKKVMMLAKSNAETLAKQSGVEPSLTEQEIIDYIQQATKEIKKQEDRKLE